MDESVPKNQRYHGLENLIVGGSLVAIAACGWVAYRRPFLVAVEGDSMAPTLTEGDFLVAMREGTIGPGTLVVVEHPDRPDYEMVKRVTAAPGDRAEDRELRPGEYWVTGDNPVASTDSRSFGPVTRRAIKGVVRARYWPVSRVAVFG
jgi:signal peptidase I